jgi:hypothetical protein
MRMLNLQPGTAAANLPLEGIVCHDVRDPAQRSEVLARKGTTLEGSDIQGLLARGVEELHLALPDPGDVAENEAATRLAAAVRGPRVTAGEAQHGQTSFISTERGMLRVHTEQLDRVNAHDGVLLLTAEADRPVEAGTTLGVVKCAPLFLAESTILAIEDLTIAYGTVLEVEAFRTRRVGLVAPRERLRGGAFDRTQAALSEALAWYGSSLDLVVGADASVQALAAAYHTVRHNGAELILAAGASGTDPLDVVFEGLRDAGGEVLQIGIPAEPGTACWIGRLDSVPVLGLASCELFGRPGALDLLLPRLLTDELLDARLLRRLAYGGLLLGPSRVAPYHAGNMDAS